MSAPSAKSRWRKLGKFVLVVFISGLLLAAGLLWYITTDSFHNLVSRRLVAQLERITGGKAEIGSLEFAPFQMRVELRDLTVHGLEKPGEAPYLHVDRLIANLKISSLLRAGLGFHSLVVDHPTLHLEIYPDGSTNQPSPRLTAENPGQGISQIEQLFSISIDRIDIRHGTLLLGSEEVPLDFAVNDFAADTSYSLLHRRFDANILLGKAQTKFDGYQPVAWTAELHFSVEHNLIELKSLKASSNGARLEVSGRVRDFLQPKVEGNYAATVDLARAVAVARRRDMRGGVLQVAGQASWSAQAFSSAGTLSVDGLAWRDTNIGLRNAKVNAKFSANRQQLVLSQIQAHLLGGNVSGDVEVANWLEETLHPSAGKHTEQTGTAHFRLNGLAIADIAEAVSTPQWPFDRIGLTGATSGSVELRWRGALRKAEAQFALDVSAPAQASPGQLPLNARARFSYFAARQEIEVAEFTANTPSTQIHASGALAQKSSLRLSVVTTDLGELQPVLVAFGGPRKAPVTLHGRALFEGTVSGKLSAMSLTGNLQANDFESLIPATGRTSERQVHWDELKAGIQLSPHSFAVRNVELRHGPAEISFDLNLGLQKGHAVPHSPITARVDARHTDLAEMLSLAGYNYPVRGTMDLHAELTGTRTEPRGEGRIQITNANAYGQDIQQFSSRLRFSNGAAELEDINIVQADERVAGSAAYNFSSRAFHFDLTGTNIDLANIPKLVSTRLTIQGRSDFTAKGSGTLEEPAINAEVRLRGLILNNQPLGDSTFNATTLGADLHLTGKSQYEQAQLTTDGTIRLRGDWPCTIKLHFNQVNADPLLRVYIKGRVNSHSLIDGDLLVQGPLRRPRELQVTGDFSNVALGLGDLNVHNDGPVRFTVTNQILTLQPFHFIGDRTDLTGSGTVQLTGERRLNLQTHGRVNLRLIQTLNRDFTSSGNVTVDLSVNGTMSNPVPQGHFEIKNGAIAHVDLPNALSEINGSLAFNQDRVQIETLSARTGGGLVKFQGYATVRNRLLNFDLTLHGEDVRLRYPPGISSTTNMDLRFAGTTTASTLSGDVTITRLAMSPGFDFASYLASSSQTSSLPQTNPLLNGIRLDVHIVTTPELQMQTTILRLSGDADVRLRGSAAKPTLLGRADITEGQLYFNGTKYHLERGEVSFLGPSGIRPNLDLQMTTRVRDYDVTVSLNGPPNKLKLQYRSEPPLPEADIVSLLALGRTREESAQQQGNSAFGQDASNALLSGALNAAVSSRIQNLFGGSRIKIDPQGLSTVTTPARGPQVTIEQQVTNNMTLTYSTNVSQATQQIIQMEYNISRNLSVVAVRDQNGVVSFDVRIRQRKK